MDIKSTFEVRFGTNFQHFMANIEFFLTDLHIFGHILLSRAFSHFLNIFQTKGGGGGQRLSEFMTFFVTWQKRVTAFTIFAMFFYLKIEETIDMFDLILLCQGSGCLWFGHCAVLIAFKPFLIIGWLDSWFFSWKGKTRLFFLYYYFEQYLVKSNQPISKTGKAFWKHKYWNWPVAPPIQVNCKFFFFC